MSAYLQFFELEQSPFEGKTGTQVVLGTKALREALDKIRDGLDEGVARICLSGGPGLGKTSLARALPKLLNEDTRIAVVLDPSSSWESQRGPLARQWGLEAGGLPRSELIEAAHEKRLVVVIDRAEAASEEFLDHLDVLLSYRTEDDEPVVQSVLLARLGHDEDGQPPPLIWWLDRIQTLQLEFAPLPRDGVEPYIRKHLKRAGWRGQRLFTSEAALAIHGYTGGIPGEVSQLCERLLAEAASSDLREIDAPFVHAFCDADDVEDESSHPGAEDEPSRAPAEVPEADEPDEAFSVANEDEPDKAFEARDDASSDEAGFDELLLAEEFAESSEPPEDAEDAPTIDLVEAVSDPEQGPSLAETLEHFADAASPEDADHEADDESGPGPNHLDELDDTSPLDAEDEDDEEEFEHAEDEDDDEFEHADSSFDESTNEYEDFLSAPVSPDELRSIQGGLIARNARAVAAAAGLALAGGIILAWLSGGEAPPAPGMGEAAQIADRPKESGGASDSMPVDEPERLARLRGPVPSPEAAPRVLEPIPASPPSTVEAETVLEEAEIPAPAIDDVLAEEPPEPSEPVAESQLAAEVEDDEDEDDAGPSEDDLVDMRPAALRPDAGDDES